MVLSHGVFDRRQVYLFLAPELALAGHRVANADLRGHGESSMGWAAITRTDIAGDLAQWADLQQITRNDSVPARRKHE